MYKARVTAVAGAVTIRPKRTSNPILFQNALPIRFCFKTHFQQTDAYSYLHLKVTLGDREIAVGHWKW